jgi:AcrR family transcriptional regulator
VKKPVRKQAGTTKAQASQGTRAHLLETTSRLLSEHNSVDVSLSEIAEASGLNSALIKYHFGNKEGLLLALVRRNAEKSLENLDRLVRMPISPEQKVRLHINGIINTYAKYPYMNRLIHTLMDKPDKRLGRDIATFFVQPLVEAQRKILQEGVDKGVFVEVNPMHFYYSIVGACDIIFYARPSLEYVFGISELTPEVRDAYAAQIADSTLRLLQRPAPTGETRTGKHNEQAPS